MSYYLKSLLLYFIITLILSGCGGSEESQPSIAGVLSTKEAPSINLISDSYNVSINESINLSWSSTNATNCVASGVWSGAKEIAGSETVGPLTEDATYSLTCSGANGETTKSVNIIVNSSQLPIPVISMQASSEIVSFNGSTLLNWTSTNASSCIASGDWAGSKSTSGSEAINSLTNNSTFILSCSGTGGTANYSVNVTVVNPELPTVTLSTSSTSVESNGSTTLSWSSTGASSCVASGDWMGDKAVSGSEIISSIITDSVYNLSCSGAGGTANYSVNVTVVMSNNGTALLSWLPPDENTDGSVLTDLAGYKIYYGTSPGVYSNAITVNNPGLSSYLVESLAVNTWYFSMSSFNSSNIESVHSIEVSKTIN